MARRRLIRGLDLPVDLLSEMTGRAPATIRRAQSMGPSRRLAEELHVLGRSLREPEGRRRAPAKKAPAKKQPQPERRAPAKKRPLPERKAPAKKQPQPERRAPAKKRPLPARKVPAKKRPLPARKVPAKKRPLPARKVPAKKQPQPEWKAPAKKRPLPARKVPAKKRPLPARKVPAKKRPLPARKVPAKKRPLPARKVPAKKPPLPARKAPAKKPPVKKRPLPERRPPVKKKPEKRRYPSFMSRAAAAEALILEHLGRLDSALSVQEPGLDTTVKAFINADATVDGELRMRSLPAEWRTLRGMPSLMATLSEAVRAMGAFPTKPSMGGAFWVSFGVRFGPKDRREIEHMEKFYKRFRGLLQVGAHHATAQSLSAILNNALTIKFLVERLWHKRDLPPVQLLVRVVWTPTNVRPGRFKGEEGGK